MTTLDQKSDIHEGVLALDLFELIHRVTRQLTLEIEGQGVGPLILEICRRWLGVLVAVLVVHHLACIFDDIDERCEFLGQTSLVSEETWD